MTEALQLTIPADRVALGLADNFHDLQDGDELKEDGWVYRSGQRVRKWYTHLTNKAVIWHPLLEDVPALETRMVRMQEKLNLTWEEHLRLREELVGVGGIAHHMVLVDGEIGWKEWKHCQSLTGGIGWHWVEIPDKPENIELGARLHKNEKRMWTIGGRVSLFKKAIKNAMYDGPFLQGELEADCVVDFNGRLYHFQFGIHGYCQFELLKVHTL